MLKKIIFSAILVVIFICDYLLLRYHLRKCRKGRMIDTFIEILIIFAGIAAVGGFSMICDKIFHIF